MSELNIVEESLHSYFLGWPIKLISGPFPELSVLMASQYFLNTYTGSSIFICLGIKDP